MGYYPCLMDPLTHRAERSGGQCQVGSLTGAVASQKVTEAPKGSLRMVGNHSLTTKYIKNLDRRIDQNNEFAGYIVNVDLKRHRIQSTGICGSF